MGAPNKRLERTRHNGSSIRSSLGEPLKRNVRRLAALVKIMKNESWSRQVAAMSVDALVDHGLIRCEDFEAAVEIAAEEIQIRLALGDYPPLDEQSASSSP